MLPLSAQPNFFSLPWLVFSTYIFLVFFASIVYIFFLLGCPPLTFHPSLRGEFLTRCVFFPKFFGGEPPASGTGEDNLPQPLSI